MRALNVILFLSSVCKKVGKKLRSMGKETLRILLNSWLTGLGLQVYVVSGEEDLKAYDAVLVTDVINPQGAYDFIQSKVDPERLLTLGLLHISRNSSVEREIA